MNTIVAVSTPKAPTPLGHYVQAVRAGGLVYVSGQLPILTEGKTDNQAATFEMQAKRVIENFLAILAAAGCGPTIGMEDAQPSPMAPRTIPAPTTI